MRKAVSPLIIGAMILTLLIGCANTPIQTAKVSVKVSKETIVLVQKTAALARDEYLDAVEENRVPGIPHLDDGNWEQYLKLEGKLVATHEVFLESVKLAESVETIDLDRMSFYLEMATIHQEQFIEIFKDIDGLLGEFDISLGEVIE